MLSFAYKNGHRKLRIHLAVDLAKIADEESILISRVARLVIDVLNAAAKSITDHLLCDYSAILVEILLVILEEGILQEKTVILVSNRGNALNSGCCHNHILS